MNVNMVYPPLSQRRGQTIALHCSGAGAREWRHLTEALAPDCEVLAPEHFGCESSGAWMGEHAFTLADEAAQTIALIDRGETKVHLVGHSYGGGVALHVALARPGRIASMALYEPSAFHLLPQMGERGREAYAEITGVARHLRESIVIGDYCGGGAAFVDYWSEPGAWNAMRPEAQRALTGWAPKGVLEFHALFSEATPQRDYLDLECPVLLMRGENAPAPTRIIAEGLAELLPDSRLVVIKGAGHMGPLTHAAEVARLMVEHIVAARLDKWWLRSEALQPCALLDASSRQARNS
jgi:pimeloyl-ACP methyl ester carboxylesterase